MYNILKAEIEFKDNQITKVTVVAEISKGDVRKIVATDKPRAGYTFIMPGAKLTDELLQKVAGYGCEV